MIVTQKDQLRNICEKVEPSEGLEVAAKLAFELESNQNGIGLAAPQIGINKRVFVLLKEDGGLLFVINPILLDKKHPYLNEVEGCLSFPNKTVSTIRYREIFWKDEFRKDIFKLEGRDALVFQHENDHLDGILMFDRSEPRKYDDCFCGSKKKYKWCCNEKVHGKKEKVSRRTE